MNDANHSIHGYACLYNLEEPGRSTLNVLNHKYKYFPPQKYLSTSTFHFGEMYLSTVHSEYFQNVLKYNQEYILIPSNFLYPENQTKFLT